MRNKALLFPKSFKGTEPRRRCVRPERLQQMQGNAAGGKAIPNVLLLLCVVAFSSVTLPQSRVLSRLTDSLHAFQGEAPIGAPRPTTFLLGIFTMTGEKQAAQRDLIRKTYLDIGDNRICKLDEFIRQAEETPNQRVCQIPYTFVIGGGGSNRPTDHYDDAPLTLDSDEFGRTEEEGDCTYLNIKENMEDGKSPTYFKFAAGLAEEYGIDYISKIDDDSVLSPDLLFQFINDDLPIAPYNRRMYGGSPVPSWGHNHVYVSGQFYFVSADLAHYVANELTSEERKKLSHARPTEDCDMGTFIYTNPNPIKLVSMNTGTVWDHPKKTLEEFAKAWDVELEETLPKSADVLPFSFYCPVFMEGRGL